MTKRFKTKKRIKTKYLKYLLFIIIITLSFNISYKLIYKTYLSKLNNEQIITHIINNTKNYKSKNKFLDYLQNPNYIIKNNFHIQELQNNIVVDNEVVESKSIEVYIYSTHETESYSDKYLEVYNIKPTVKTMSYILKDYLEDLGIKTYIEEKSITKILKDHNWSYKYSYDASKIAITDTINNNPSLKLIIDLHRDSSSLSKTLLNYNNTTYAKILFVIGLEHQNYSNNLELATTLNNLLINEIPGISRGLSKKSGPGVNGIYNQDLSPKSVLIELGGQYNEIEELNNSLKVLAKVILKYIEGET